MEGIKPTEKKPEEKKPEEKKPEISLPKPEEPAAVPIKEELYKTEVMKEETPVTPPASISPLTSGTGPTSNTDKEEEARRKKLDEKCPKCGKVAAECKCPKEDKKPEEKKKEVDPKSIEAAVQAGATPEQLAGIAEKELQVMGKSDVKKYDPHRDPTDILVNLESKLKKIYEQYQMVKKAFDTVKKSMTDYDPRAATGTVVLGEIKDPTRKKTVLKEGEEMKKAMTDFDPRASSDPKETLGKVQMVQEDIREEPKSLKEILGARRAQKSTQPTLKSAGETLEAQLAKIGYTKVEVKREPQPAENIKKSTPRSMVELVSTMPWNSDALAELDAEFQRRKFTKR